MAHQDLTDNFAPWLRPQLKRPSITKANPCDKRPWSSTAAYVTAGYAFIVLEDCYELFRPCPPYACHVANNYTIITYQPVFRFLAFQPFCMEYCKHHISSALANCEYPIVYCIGLARELQRTDRILKTWKTNELMVTSSKFPALSTIEKRVKLKSTKDKKSF